MKILYFAPHEPWPLTTGARLRDYHLASQLARWTELTFVGVRNSKDPPPEPIAHSPFKKVVLLTKDASYTPGKILRGLAGPNPIPVLNFLSRRMRNELEAVLSDGYDTVQVEGIQLTPYLDTIRAAKGSPLIVSDWHNIESELMWRYAEMAKSFPRRWVAKRTAHLMQGTEKHLLSVCDAYIIASERERAQLSQPHGQAGLNMQVIPNGVDMAHYTNSAIAEACKVSPPPTPDRYLLFVGSMDYHANIDGVVWFTRTIWPDIQSRYPGLKFVIAGRNPASEIRALASDRVLVTGTVADVRPMYGGAAVVVVPLRVGSGTRLKILEAMAAGVPVISTTLGAEGIEATRGAEILIADTAAETLTAVERVLAGEELRQKLVLQARSLVSARYDWALLGERLFQIHRDTIRLSQERTRP